MKRIMIAAASCGLLAVLSACSCWKPLNDTCSSTSHDYKKDVPPTGVLFNQQAILPPKDNFRPVFEAGKRRVHAIGNGSTAYNALQDAVAKLCLELDPALIQSLPDESIYGPGPRCAQPDESWNSQRGDGLEKAFLLAALLHSRAPEESLTLETDGRTARLRVGTSEHLFPTANPSTFTATWPV